MIFTLREPGGTPADGDKGSAEGRYVEVSPRNNDKCGTSKFTKHVKYHPPLNNGNPGSPCGI